MKRLIFSSLLVLPLAACGDDDGGDNATTSSTTDDQTSTAGMTTTGGVTTGDATTAMPGSTDDGGTTEAASTTEGADGSSGSGGSGSSGGSSGSGGGEGGALYEVCGDGQPDCGAGLDCVITPVPDGSTTQGYCSPACTEPAECTDGYDGPGSPSCFGGSCVISCTNIDGDGECPEGLTCLSTGGPTNACFVAA